ncbi:Oligosaccharyl transferase subunit ost3/OST6 [Lachancea thermotolerans]|uniref:KLTH0G08404p n=1 Tax=Lachancea thermotolerans (strain ATCC 56472 / CBS 6340 / NRRL Y-8284) TaxID=559295 RepID=C5DMF3_LACTC|nr:KLTH0G08404p [Lachancea thermotolerans CBS 6340]CAR24964.1 KLTH0G08404p [Lachancea thermotolerans CBS 6340]
MRFTQLAVFFAAFFLPFISAISNEKLSKEASRYKGIIQLTNNNFKRILDSKREAYIVVLLTATNAQVGCTLCMELDPEFSMMADSWYKDHPEGLSESGTGMFFARADFDPKKNSDVFMHFKVNNVPRLLFLTPQGDPSSFSQINLPGEGGMTRVLAIVNTLRDATGISDFKIYQPINWGSVFVTAFATAAVTLLVKKYKPVAAKLITSKYVWGLATVFVIILWNAGYMFNSIRGSQFAGMTQDGSAVIYFMEGQQQNQFGIETQIVGVIYGVLASCVAGLVLFVPYAKQFYATDKSGRPTLSKACFVEFSLTLSFLVTLYLVYGALTGVFKLKSPGYPFKLIKFPFH